MDWINMVQKTLNEIEDHLLEEINAESLARNVYTSGDTLQRVFRIVTGCTVGDYIRGRRLSAAGEELSGGEVKVLDTALKYGYESPESFTKAFTRFHGVTPSSARKQSCKLNYLAPLKIQITIEGGSIMSRKLIPNVEKVYENKAENYMFPSCMRSALSALKEDGAYDFTFFAGVTGDLFCQTWLEPKWRYNDSYSNVCREAGPLRAAFDACGYEYAYIPRTRLQGDRAGYRQKIVDSIDRGVPILAFGIVGPPVCSIVCGYGEDGEVLIGWSQFTGETTEDPVFDHEFSENYFQVRGGLEHTDALLFFGKKKERPALAECLRKSLQEFPRIASLPPENGVLFGKAAFDAWADSLLCEEAFERADQLEGPLDTYLSCVVQTGTNLYHVDGYLKRTAELCPDTAGQVRGLLDLFSREREAFDRMIEFQGGYFFEKDRAALLDQEFRASLSELVRQVGECYQKAAAFLAEG